MANKPKFSNQLDRLLAMAEQELSTTWYGEEASQEAYLNNAKKMEQYTDLLKE